MPACTRTAQGSARALPQSVTAAGWASPTQPPMLCRVGTPPHGSGAALHEIHEIHEIHVTARGSSSAHCCNQVI
eukprot:4911667-Prymnesium_polylepis.1